MPEMPSGRKLLKFSSCLTALLFVALCNGAQAQKAVVSPIPPDGKSAPQPLSPQARQRIEGVLSALREILKSSQSKPIAKADREANDALDVAIADATAKLEEALEMNMSLSLQELQLQQQIDADVRRFSLLSAAMRAKHEAARQALQNLR